MGAIKCCTFTVAVLGILLGLLHSSTLSESGALTPLLSAKPEMIGSVPLMSKKSAFSFGDLRGEDVKGKNVIVMGSANGMGFNTAFQLADKGANVMITCPFYKDCYTRAQVLNRALGPENHVKHFQANVSALENIRSFTNSVINYWTKIDIVVLNLDAHVETDLFETNADGIEKGFVSHYLKNVLIFRDLRKFLERAASKGGSARIITVSSGNQFSAPANPTFPTLEELQNPSLLKQKYSEKEYLGILGLAQVLFSEKVAKLEQEKAIFSNSVTLGHTLPYNWVDIKLDWYLQLLTYENMYQEKFGHRLSLEGTAEKIVAFAAKIVEEFVWSPEEASLTPLYLAASPLIQANNVRGKHFQQVAAQVERRTDIPENASDELWESSLAILKELGFA